MAALLVSGAAVVLALASSTHPRVAVHSPSQASSVTRGASLTQTASRTQAAAGTQTTSPRQAISAEQAALAVVGGPSQVTGAALANAATGKVLWGLALNTERPIGSIVKVMTAAATPPGTRASNAPD